MPEAFCDDRHRAELEAFLGPRAKQHPGAPKELEAGLEALKACSAAWARNKAAIGAFLAKH